MLFGYHSGFTPRISLRRLFLQKERKKGQPQQLNFSALHLLHDPQGFAETLYTKHLANSKSKLNLLQKLLVLQLVSRLVGLHKLTLINLYSYFLK